MRIATLQFSPTLGATPFNTARADHLLKSLSSQDQLDLLVLPELAFSGYNFPSLAAIQPYLEPTASGPTTNWAISTAKRLGCHVTIGYPERCEADGRNYNSTVTVSPTGEILLKYRKSFLYYTDETWASEGPSGSSSQHEKGRTPFFTGTLGALGHVGHGICMDINPYKFTAPWTDYEFANCMLANNVKLVVLSTAWLTRLSPEELQVNPEQADMETLTYWLERFYPFFSIPSTSPANDDSMIVVFANRSGTEGASSGSSEVENGSEVETGDRVCYAGSSCVVKFDGGKVCFLERGEPHQGPSILGKGEEGVLVVDTRSRVSYTLQAREG